MLLRRPTVRSSGSVSIAREAFRLVYSDFFILASVFYPLPGRKPLVAAPPHCASLVKCLQTACEQQK